MARRGRPLKARGPLPVDGDGHGVRDGGDLEVEQGLSHGFGPTASPMVTHSPEGRHGMGNS
jgi:hypothetical protein